MSNEIKVFEHEMFGEIRVTDQNGDPWFIAKDVATALGYKRAPQAVSQHCKGVRETRIPSKGGNQITNIIPEHDVYRLVMRSNLPEAEKFQDWVVEEVLPSIRKSGGYLSPEIDWTDLNTIQRVLDIAKDARKKQRIAELRVNTAEKKISKLEPLANGYKKFMATDGLMLVREASKVLCFENMGQNNLYSFLRDKKVIMTGKREPYQKYVSAGCFVVREKIIDFTLRQTTYVTPKGLAYIHTLLERNGHKRIGG